MLDLVEVCASHRATLIRVEPNPARPGKKLLQFTCACGGNGVMTRDNILYGKQPVTCSRCSKDRKSSLQLARKDAEIKAWFEGKSATYLGVHSRGSDNTHLRIQIRCACERTFLRTFNELKRTAVNPECDICRVHRYKTVCGPLHPNYNPEIADEDRQPRGGDDNRWYEAIFQKHHYTCVITGQIGGELSAHHLYNYRDYPEHRLSLENGVCITRELHKEFHAIYGRRNNTPEQFEEFRLNQLT